jgi:DNA repair exonuclease SbcCD ATPase subunit
MYELIRLSFHNWYVFEVLDLDVTGMIAVIGPTGAGKSAILDGIQVVITGNNGNFIDLNPSAGEKSDRTVLSYCLGQVSDFDRVAPKRERGETTLALTFRDTATGVPLTIGLLLHADHSERTETPRALFVARGYAFSFGDFIERDVDGDEFVVSHDEIIERLKKACGKTLTLHPRSRQFVAEYLAAMRPRSSPDARLFLRSFNNAVLAREIRDPTDFVRRFVLEADPLNVERIRSSIETWRSMEKRAEALEMEIRAVRLIRSRFATWARQTLQAQTEEYITHAAEKMRLEFEIRELKRERERAEEESASFNRLIVGHTAVVAENRDQVLRKRTLLSGGEGASKLRTIEVEERVANDDKIRAVASFDGALNEFRHIAQFSAIRQFVPIVHHGAIQAAAELVRAAGEHTTDRLVKESESLADKARRALAILAVRASLAQQRDIRISEITEDRQQANSVEQSLRGAGDGRGSMLSRHVRQFMSDLAMNGVQSVALPDAVEISDESWAPALEMLLGPNREALIVPETQVVKAFDFLWRNRSRLHSCRIVNTRKTRRGPGRTVQPLSIAHVLRTSNPDARVFVDTQVGRYVRADTEHDLQDHDFAVMRNGKTTAALSLRVFGDLSPILGKTAQTAAIAAAREKLALLHKNIDQKDRELNMLDSAVTYLAGLERRDDVVAQLREAAEGVRRAEGRREALRKEREGVEDPKSQALRHEIERIEKETARYETELEGFREKERRSSSRATSAADRITEREGSAALELEAAQVVEREQATDRMTKLAAFAEAGEFTIGEAQTTLGVLVFQKRGEELKFLAERRNQAKQAADEYTRLALGNGTRALRAFGEYVREYIQGPSPLPDDADHAEHCFWCAAREQRLEEHELRPHREKVIQARHEFEAALKEDLLAKMSDRFEKIKTQLDILNKRLAAYSFVGQKYSFKRYISPDFKPLYDLVRRIVGSQDSSFAALADKASTADDEMKRAMAQVEEIVTRDQDTRRLEDYRNYFEFELFLENEAGEQQAFSKLVGLLSGGQRQAPYYVAIAASMVSVYFPKAGREGGTEGMGLVAFDEAFNKLDIGNTQNLIKLYRDLGLQLVIAAPEIHRSTFLESVDCIISVTRMNGTDRVAVDSERIGPRAQAEMLAANPEHRGVEWFRSPTEQTTQKAAE